MMPPKPKKSTKKPFKPSHKAHRQAWRGPTWEKIPGGLLVGDPEEFQAMRKAERDRKRANQSKKK